MYEVILCIIIQFIKLIFINDELKYLHLMGLKSQFSNSLFVLLNKLHMAQLYSTDQVSN